ncbi:MAG: hypothetical protein RI564_10855, partial [Gracilimonas sp.]|nr:hypothetical protein [Gracilimonas sp.]
YFINEQRLRGPSPDPDKDQILALGDSFTFGLLLDQEDTYLHLMQEKMGSDSLQILNGGIGGSGLADWPGWLAEFGQQINPDYILYYMNTEDLERALSKNLFVLEGDSVIKSQRWKPRDWMFSIGRQGWYQCLQAHSDFFNLVVKVLWAKVYFNDLTHGFDPQKTEVPIPDNSEFLINSDYSLRLANHILHNMNNWCSENDCELIITTTGYFSIEDPPAHTYRLYEWLKEQNHDFTFFDITPCVDDLAQNDLSSITIPDDGHPNERGAEIIAKCTRQKLPGFL